MCAYQLRFIIIALWSYLLHDEKSPASLIENTFYMMRHFLLMLSRFSLCLFTIWLSVSRSGSLWIYFTWSQTSWMCILLLFYQIWDIFGHCFFRYSFTLFVSLLLGLSLFVWWHPADVWGSVQFSFRLSVWIISIDPPSSLLILSSANLYLLLSPLLNFLISIIVFFHSRTFISFFFYSFSLFISILYFMRHLFLYFSSLDMVSF